jgi:hypothetical protein
MNFIKKYSLQIFAILAFATIAMLGLMKRSNINENKVFVDGLIFDVITSPRTVSIKYEFIYKSLKYTGKISAYGKYFIGDTCIISIDSSNPTNNYFVELKNPTIP